MLLKQLYEVTMYKPTKGDHKCCYTDGIFVETRDLPYVCLYCGEPRI